MSREAISVPKSEDVIVPTDRTLYIDRAYPDGIAMFEGNQTIAYADSTERDLYARVILWMVGARMPITAKIGTVGAGTCYLQRLLNVRFREEAPGANTIDVFEIHQEIADWNIAEWGVNQFGWNFVVGDYLTTLVADAAYDGVYDLLIHDAFDTPDRPALEAKLTPTGTLLVLDDFREG